MSVNISMCCADIQHDFQHWVYSWCSMPRGDGRCIWPHFKWHCWRLYWVLCSQRSSSGWLLKYSVQYLSLLALSSSFSTHGPAGQLSSRCTECYIHISWEPIAMPAFAVGWVILRIDKHGTQSSNHCYLVYLNRLGYCSRISTLYR